MSPDETEDTDGPARSQIELNLPFDSAFDECMHALRQFRYRELMQFDPDRGTIEVRVSSQNPIFAGMSYSFADEERITFALQKLDFAKTKVTITSGSIFRPEHPANRLHNQENLTRISSFLLNRESGQGSEAGTGYSPTLNGFTKERWVLVEPAETAFMSLLIPGLGQNHAGRYVRGMVIAILVAAGLVFYVIPGVMLWLANGYDAYRIAQRINLGSLPFIPVKSGLKFLHVIAGGGAIFLVILAVIFGFSPFH